MLAGEIAYPTETQILLSNVGQALSPANAAIKMILTAS
jgi:hypothetical protein